MPTDDRNKDTFGTAKRSGKTQQMILMAKRYAKENPSRKIYCVSYGNAPVNVTPLLVPEYFN